MQRPDATPTPTSTTLRQTAPTDRWQSFQALISRQAQPVYGWARRSSLISRWPGVPASVSASLTTG